MDLVELQRKLIAAARSHPPSEAVPLAFEKRVLAQIRARPVLDHWAMWACALWRAAAPCVAIAVLLGAWTWLGPAASPPPTDLSQDWENSLLSAAVQEPGVEVLR